MPATSKPDPEFVEVFVRVYLHVRALYHMQSMSETHEVLTSPAPGTVIAPIHQYSEQQAAEIKALRQVRQITFSNHETLTVFYY